MTQRLHERRRRLRSKRGRRGVLLLVVLSMLVLFLLVGTTFVITSASFRQGSKAIEEKHQTSLQPGDRLERALLQVLRDTNNPHSAVRYHSLLRDVYGTDGFVGHVYAGAPEILQTNGSSTGNFMITDADLNNIGGGFTGPVPSNNNPAAYSEYASRYAGATDPNFPLGPTGGQLIDIYVQDDMGLVSPGPESQATRPDLLATPEANVGLRSEYVVDLELNEQGLTTNHSLSRTGGYYNGCLLTILEGPAKGQTTRVVQYDYLTLSPEGNNNDANLARFRVLAFPRNDGAPLQLGLNPRVGTPNDLVYAVDSGNPLGVVNDNDPFYGVRFMVNGRAVNGAGVGLNQRAGIADPKLSALELMQLPGVSSAEFIPVALAPNAAYHSSQPHYSQPFDTANAPATLPIINYGVYPGPGGADESYDAADFQNMFLALQSPTPRPEGRVISSARGPLHLADTQAANLINSDQQVRLHLDDVPIPSFHRPALVNYWFHRLYNAPWITGPSSANQKVQAILDPYGANGLPQHGLSAAEAAQITAIKRKISLRPLREDHPDFDGSNPESRYANRLAPGSVRMVDEASDEITFPYWEATGPWDVDNDNDGVPDSIWVDLGDPVQKLPDGRLYKPLYAILVEDLDGRLNINEHGTKEHFASDSFDQAKNGLSPLFSNPEVAIDDSINPAQVIAAVAGNIPVAIPPGVNTQAELEMALVRALRSSNQLPHGRGWGPGDISLRPLLSPELIRNNPARIGDSSYDDYARLLAGRSVPDGFTPNATSAQVAISAEQSYGRYGSFELAGSVGAGVNFVDGTSNVVNSLNTTDLLGSYKLYNFPQFDTRNVRRVQDGKGAPIPASVDAAARGESVVVFAGAMPSGFGEMHDLPGRYAAPGLSYGGVPMAESAYDPFVPPLVADSPYELRVMEDDRRGEPAVSSPTLNDDAPFSAAELERILRAHDPDAGRLPGRLWNLVDAFDPAKLVVQLNLRNNTNPMYPYVAFPADYPNSSEYAVAVIESASRRRQVTTDSREVPGPTDSWSSRLVYGADGRPGAGGVDEEGEDNSQDAPDADTLWDGSVADADDLDNAGEFNRYSGGLIDLDGDGVIDPGEVGGAVTAFNENIDDYFVVMGADPPVNARLIDYLRYRIVLELKRSFVIPTGVFLDVDRAQAFAGVADPTQAGPYGFSQNDLDQAEARINAVLYGNNAAQTAGVRHVVNTSSQPIFASYGGLIDPDVIGGAKMDLNRPFGDGRDNNGNGVVDEPAEAGEPWIDLDGNGRWTSDEPYQDLDGDGRFYANVNGDNRADGDGEIDNDDDWFDTDGDGIEEPNVDNLYSKQLGEAVAFDHTRGLDANGRGKLDGGSVVNDDGRMARQLYARHLYCLMLAVMDENYLAPYDDLDPQVMNYLDPDAETTTRDAQGQLVRQKSMAMQIKEVVSQRLQNQGMAKAEADIQAAAEARRQAQRKLTCRQVAQWAINCADMRDADAVMTPFEYDENPWDGWNVVDPDAGQVYPIDGDPSTDENAGDYVEISSGGWNRVDNPTVAAPNQTCGIVWGAERPEAILTEGLAMHDRRVEDLLGPGDVGEVGERDDDGNQITTSTGLQKNDDDLDQRLRPRGSVFIEIFNPWDDASHKPAELYRDPGGVMRGADINKNGTVEANEGVEGLMLDRLSDGLATPLDERGNPRLNTPVPSPVWRMICVEEHPDMRNDDPYDAPLPYASSAYPERSTTNAFRRPGYNRPAFNRWPAGTLSNADKDMIGGNAFGNLQLPYDWDKQVILWRQESRKEVSAPLRMTNPDFPSFDPYASPLVLRQVGDGERPVYVKPKAYVEREWYFTRGELPPANPATGSLDPADVRLCIPVRPLVLQNGADIVKQTNNAERKQYWPDYLKLQSPRNAAGQVVGSPSNVVIYPWRFPPTTIDVANQRLTQVRPAPLLPGRYAVIGSAGVQYRQGGRVLRMHEGRYTTTISRKVVNAGNNDLHAFTEERNVDQAVRDTRRIELIPNPNPHLHQVVVGMNGGDECRLLQPVGPPEDAVYVFNATDPSSYPGDANAPGTTRAGTNLKDFNLDPAQRSFTNLTPSEYPYYAIKPAIAVPIEGMNISEPLDSYFFRKAELDKKLELEGSTELSLDWNRTAEAGEGKFEASSANPGVDEVGGYDEPFDIQPELAINHTTPNYRTVHLQRLADPTLAWNPPPLRPGGQPHPQHDPQRPVNPYCTVDSMSLDLTAFNSINDHERRIEEDSDRITEANEMWVRDVNRGREWENNFQVEELHKMPHDLPPHAFDSGTAAGDATKVLMTLSSQFRGFHDQILSYGDEDNATLNLPLEKTLTPGRAIWAQERANQVVDILDDRIDVFDTRPQPHSDTESLDGVDRVHQDFAPRGPGTGGLAMNFPIRHSLGYDNLATRRRIVNKPPGDTATGAPKPFYPSKVELRGIFTSDLNEDYTAANPVYPIDVNGDGIPGDLVGVPRVNEANTFAADNPKTEPDDMLPPADDPNVETGRPDYRDDITFPWLTWNDRPYVSGPEVLLTPASSSARIMTDYSIVNPFESDPASRYDGFAVPEGDGSAVGDQDDGGAWETNRARIGATKYPYGHLLPMFQASSQPAVTLRDPIDGEPVPVGAGNFHRLLDYVHTPSPFVGTELLMDPTVFNAGAAPTPGDPRQGFLAPFNTVSKHREPGKVNLNTVVGRTDPSEANDRWSEVYDGLMHRLKDANFINYGVPDDASDDALIALGHFGPAWRDVELSRRGYNRQIREPRLDAVVGGTATVQDYSPYSLSPNFPTRFANPFRSATAGDLVPLSQLAQYGVDASVLRSHPFSPGENGAWGTDGDDYLVDKSGDGLGDRDLITNNGAEAGAYYAGEPPADRYVSDDILLVRPDGALPNSQKEGFPDDAKLPVEPLFAEGTTEAALDAGRNPGIAYNPMTRLANLTTTRSGVFAVWITVGFFEVTPAPSWNDPDATIQQQVRARFGNNLDMYNRVYPEGYQLGKEIGIETGDTTRFRGFWIIDRTLPVAFKPGENVNSERAILLERRIE